MKRGALSFGFRWSMMSRSSALAILLATSAYAQSGGGYNIKKSTIDGGGVTFHTGGGYKLGGTVGQHEAAEHSGGGYDLYGGFWSPVVAGDLPPNILWDSSPTSTGRSTRSLSFSTATVAATGTGTAAIQVAMIELQNPIPPNAVQYPPPDFTAYETATCTAVGESNGCARWVGPTTTVQESQDNVLLGTLRVARLQCTPYYTNWTTLGEITVFGAEVIPSSSYEFRAFSSTCKGTESTCTNVSGPVQALTRRSGDVASVYTPPSPTAQPDGNDVSALINKFKNLAGAPSKRSALIAGNYIELNLDVGGMEIVQAVDAFKGLKYPYTGPCACPSGVTCGALMCASNATCSGGLCIKTCNGGVNLDQPCLTNAHCPSSTCGGTGFCRDRCGRCQD